MLLKTGSLPTNLTILEEYTIGPSLGKENIKNGITAVIVSFMVIFSIILLYYNKFGLIANSVLILNFLLLFTLLIVFNITLTLYGIAGLVLTLGMAIDSNVLIFERIKEEIKTHNHNENILLYNNNYFITKGFSLAQKTIIDANLTTFIVGIILYSFGTGLVKSFAITLCLGLITSFYTTVICAKFLILFFYKHTNKNLPIG